MNMEKLKEWAVLLLFLSAGSLIYCFLLPSGNISKTVKSIVSVVSLSLICMPLFGLNDFIKEPLFPEDTPPEIKDYSSYIKDEAKHRTEELIYSVIKKYTPVPCKIYAGIDINEDNCINIEYVSIVFSAHPDREKEIREELFRILGIMPIIKTEEVHE